jgi:hypothetical protein
LDTKVEREASIPLNSNISKCLSNLSSQANAIPSNEDIPTTVPPAVVHHSGLHAGNDEINKYLAMNKNAEWEVKQFTQHSPVRSPCG